MLKLNFCLLRLMSIYLLTFWDMEAITLENTSSRIWLVSSLPFSIENKYSGNLFPLKYYWLRPNPIEYLISLWRSSLPNSVKFFQSKLENIGESRMEMDYRLVENEGLFQEYLEMGKLYYFFFFKKQILRMTIFETLYSFPFFSASIWIYYHFCGSFSTCPIFCLAQQLGWNSFGCTKVCLRNQKSCRWKSWKHWNLVQDFGHAGPICSHFQCE